MQVANAVNNCIRILFNPRVEDFKLFDFLMVKSDDNRYIAQIIEIYDNKFDASQNIAKLKLFYKIAQNNEVMPYDNFTPNRECEIVKLKQEEIENFINQDKKTFIFATNSKTSCSLDVQYDFFNNAIILADKIENSNSISLNLAKNLSIEKNVVIIDSTGILEFENAKKIKASKNFRMPLNYTTIDFIFNKCLSDASLEFQAIGGEIINEIKKFAKKQENGFIPFNAFTRVLLEQYKATPYPELKALLTRLKRFQMDEIFARTKKDNETLFKTIEKNPITILDLSGIEISWQKAYLEYIVEDINLEIYLITRINDENCDVDLINKIYNQKRNIKFIPNVSYNYKKLPSIMQYCKNYVLLPSLYQRTDFLDANFALSNLISEGCIIFGENTDNFLYLARDYELEIQEKRKNYRKIALSLVEDDEAEQEKEVSKTDSEKLMEELNKLENKEDEIIHTEDFFEDKNLDENEVQEEKETFEEIENPKLINQPKTNNDDFTTISEGYDYSEKETVEESKDDFVELNESPNEKKKDNVEIETKEKLITPEAKEDKKSFLETLEIEENKINATNLEEIKKEETVEIETINQEPTLTKNLENEDTKEQTQKINEDKINEIFNANEENTIDFNENQDSVELSDEELDFFQIAKESSVNYKKENVNIDNIEYKTQNIDDDEELSLNEIANTSLDNSFEQIIDSKPLQNKEIIEIDENTSINTDIIEKHSEDQNLPIFKEEVNENSAPTFKIGDIITHKKYGRGTVVKTIKYEQRQLVQVEFEEFGKKLLDPKVADIKLEQ